MLPVQPVAELEVPFGGYFLIRRIAVGGMAEIFLARPRGAATDDFIVVKRLLGNIASEKGLVQMFLDEARIAATMDHPNIVQIFNVGSVGDEYFLSMEHLIGLDLAKINREFHRKREAMQLQHVLSIGHGIASALHYAHHHRGRKGEPLNIVHRDLSPHNVVLTLDGQVKLLDFGVAKAANALHKSRTGTFVGKLAYMSPEQCLNADELDGRSDLFSLGIILWELALARRLYSVKKLGEYETLRRLTEQPAPDPREYDPSIPQAVVDLLDKAMAKAPEDRFQTGEEFAKAIETLAASLNFRLDSDELSKYIETNLPQVIERVTASIPRLEHTHTPSNANATASRYTPSPSPAPDFRPVGTSSSLSLSPLSKSNRTTIYSPFLQEDTHRRTPRSPPVVWNSMVVRAEVPKVVPSLGGITTILWLLAALVALAIAFAIGYVVIS